MTLLVTTLMARPFPDGDKALLEICSLLDPHQDPAGTTLHCSSENRIWQRLAHSPLAVWEEIGWALKATEPVNHDEN